MTVITKNNAVVSDHGVLSGLGDDDHSQYVLVDGSRGLSGDWDAGSHKITAEEFAGWGIVPVGGVIAWLKSFTGTPSLPDGFVECNGQALSDADSVYDGQTIPNLNGGQRYLRGKTTSGTVSGEGAHKHNFLAYRVGISLGLVYYYFPSTNTTYYTTTTPEHYSVVWVMRIK